MAQQQAGRAGCATRTLSDLDARLRMAGTVRNILFIMCDQLRWDHLSCYGHPTLKTPHIDSIASMGVRFDRAYVQSPVCGPSRNSTYTGRTVFSHGATWNGVPLPIGELAMGDYLRPLGVRTAVVGKTHLVPDREGLARLGLNSSADIGVLVAEPGFEPYERDDGVHPTGRLKHRGKRLRYNDWLNEKGYPGDNPWNDYANSAEGPNGEVMSGWQLRNSHLPARVKEEHSETAYMTDRAMEFIRETGEQPWLLHLSYIKPHWPYMAPAPYHAMYGPNSFVPVRRSERERQKPNPVYGAFMKMEVAESFSRDEVRARVLSAYMGLIKQIDDHIGRLMAFLKQAGRLADTMIVFTSDHGDYLGDHWMGEKELFHEVSVRVPLIVYDPSKESDLTRGTATTRFVEAIDLLPTFLEAHGAALPSHRLEGQSILPLLHGVNAPEWRDYVFSEIDYAFYEASDMLDIDLTDARGYMIRTDRWKYVYFKKFPPQLFDLQEDPDEFTDLGESPDHAGIRHELQQKLFERLLDRRNRVTVTDEDIRNKRRNEVDSGIIIGRW
jgi:arylsulfatase A-like enzyme